MRVGVGLDTAASYPASEGVDRNDHHRVTAIGRDAPGTADDVTSPGCEIDAVDGPEELHQPAHGVTRGESTTAPWAARAPAPMVRSTSSAPTSANVTRAVSRTSRAHPLLNHQSRWSRSAGAVVRSSSPATATSAVRVPVNRSLLHTKGKAGDNDAVSGTAEPASAGRGRSESTMPRDRTSMSRRYALRSRPARGHRLSPAQTEGRSPCRDLPGSRVAAAGTATP